MEGTRPILLELQALVSGSNYGTPRRTILGLDAHRVEACRPDRVPYLPS